MPEKPAGLRLAGVDAGYGHATVVRGLNLDVAPGEVVALLGPNGAGKTTSLLTISGVLRPKAGSISLDGADLVGKAPEAVAQAGVCQVPEGRGLFGELTVLENLKMGLKKRGTIDGVFETLPALRPLRRRRVSLLSGGEQQMLAVGRAMARRPRLLLLDEMSMGLAPQIVERLLEAIRTMARDNSTAVLLVEQHVPIALEFSDRAYVLVHGQIVLKGPAESFRGRVHEIQAEYLGSGSLRG